MNDVCVAVDDALSADIEEAIKQQPTIQNNDFQHIFQSNRYVYLIFVVDYLQYVIVAITGSSKQSC